MAVERTARPTVEDVFRLSAQGLRYEIVDGELVEMPPRSTAAGWARTVRHCRLVVAAARRREALAEVPP